MYTYIGRIYYTENKLDDARKLKNSALITLTNRATHIPLIVQFAIMEFTCGEEYQAEALFETVLQLNPKRVDVWTSYVDQLVKKNKIEVARRVLERASFEAKYGDDETRAHWQKLLENYTKQFGNIQK
ncbi:hypothetical protein Trydic_g10963 [Trypoxylus dichotomus]